MKADAVGEITPAVLVQLRAGEKILADHEIMLHMDGGLRLARRTMSQLGVPRTHLMALHATGAVGEEYYFAEYEGPGSITFSRDKGGEVRIRELAPGETIRLRSGHLICFDTTVRYMPQVLARWVVTVGNDTRTEYAFVDDLTGPGTIVYQAFGNILSFELGAGERLHTAPEALLASAATTTVQVVALPVTGGIAQWTYRPIFSVQGPGAVLVHSGGSYRP